MGKDTPVRLETVEQSRARLKMAAGPWAPNGRKARSGRPSLKTTTVAKSTLWLLALSVGGFAFAFPHAYLPWSGLPASTHGVVTEVNNTGSGESRTCHPSAEFVLDGLVYRADTSDVLDSCALAVGDAVNIRYQPGSPGNAAAEVAGWKFRASLLTPLVLLLAATLGALLTVACAARDLLIRIGQTRRPRLGQ